MAKLPYVDGVEEFIYVLGHCMINYGSLIGSSMVRVALSSTNLDISALSIHEGSSKPTPCFKEAHELESSSNEVSTSAHSYIASQKKEQHIKTPSNPRRLPTSTNVSRPSHSPLTGSGSPPQADEDEEQIRRMKVDLSDDNSVLDWNDVAGLVSCKLALDEFASFFLHFPHLTRSLRKISTTGVLLFGPQGTGKTLLVKSFAKKYNLALYDIRASSIMSKFVGDSEKFIRALFTVVRNDTPAILMLDECDGLLCNPNADTSQSHSYRLLQNEIKNQWSDLMYSRDEVIVIGATNKPQDIDMDGFGRRLSLKLLVDLPSAVSCEQILTQALGDIRHTIEKKDLENLGRMCHEHGLSGFDIDTLVEGQLRRSIRAIVVATHFRRIKWKATTVLIPCPASDTGAVPGPWTSITDRPEMVSHSPVGAADLREAVQRAKPTVDDHMIQKHVEFASRYGTEMN